MIKILQPNQIDDVMNIWLASTTRAHPFIPESYWARNFMIVKKQYLPNAVTFTAEEDGQVQGFISMMGNHIGALFIAPAFQKQGIGSSLLSHCKKEYDQLTVSVYVKNQNAVGFYRSQGFGIDEEKLDNAAGELEYLMSWVSDEFLDLLMSMHC